MASLWALPALAQLEVGENTSMSLSGNLTIGYDGGYSNQTPSSHDLSPGGNADFNGYYYSPSFLTFDVQPFYNQDRANSSYQSVFQTGGLTSNASIFSGSAFPGSVSFSKIYNSSGSFAIPGVGSLTTKANSQNFGLNWGINLPDYPKVAFSFSDNSSVGSVFGTDAQDEFHNKGEGMNVSDQLAGFNLNGGFRHENMNSSVPAFIAGEGTETSESSSNTFNVSASHKLPMHGAFSVGGARSDVTDESSGDKFSGTIDSLSSGVDFAPVRNLDTGVSAQYTNNLEGSFYQSLLTAGGSAAAALLSTSTHSLDINAHASYSLPAQHLTFTAMADRREQTLLDTSLTADSFTEMANYGNDFLGGFINATSSVTETTMSLSSGSHSIGFTDTLSYNRRFGKWNITGSGDYSRDNQTVFIGYTTSGYGYSANVGRKMTAHSYFSVATTETKSTYTGSGNSNSDSQSYTGSLTLHNFGATGSYGKANGLSVLTPTGLVSISGPVVTPFPTVFFNGKSYAGGASYTPSRGLIFSATYSSNTSNTLGSSIASENTTRLLTGLLQYKVRKIWITGGYLRLQQGFSITGQPPLSDSSFYIGMTRWFKAF